MLNTSTVRDYFCQTSQQTENSPGSHEFHLEFDRWLAEVERAAAEKAYERGRLDERHDCERYGEYERGEITGPQLRDNLRHPNPYRRNEGANE